MDYILPINLNISSSKYYFFLFYPLLLKLNTLLLIERYITVEKDITIIPDLNKKEEKAYYNNDIIQNKGKQR